MAVLRGIQRFLADGSSVVSDLSVSDELFYRLRDRYAGGVICIFPGFTDVHVHFREPGYSYKETIASGRRAAARGGYTDVCTMPNLSPVPDSTVGLRRQLELIGASQHEVGVHPFGAITLARAGKELSDMDAIAGQVCGFSDDGSGVSDTALMRLAMRKVKSLGKLISAHCEDLTLTCGGCIHAGSYAVAHALPGICSESEWMPIKRDLELARETGCRYHVCHVSTKESVELIRQAKRDGIDVTCETAPHYLTLTQDDLRDEGRFKMNPPLREEADRIALIEGLRDGTVDMIATDHAPHSAEEKSKGLLGSAMGIVGLETAFPVIYTHLVRKGLITLSDAVRLFSTAPRRRFGFPDEPDSYCVWELSESYTIRADDFATMGRSTPFEGESVYGRCLMTVKNGTTVYLAPELS